MDLLEAHPILLVDYAAATEDPGLTSKKAGPWAWADSGSHATGSMQG